MKDLVRPLSKKHRLGTPVDSQHAKGSETYIKSAWEHFHLITLRDPDLENISLNDMLNLIGVS